MDKSKSVESTKKISDPGKDAERSLRKKVLILRESASGVLMYIAH